MTKILAVVGNSGSGKTTLTNHLAAAYADKFLKAKQFTTKPARPNEEDNYEHITKEEFESLKETLVGVTNCFGNSYGTKVQGFPIEDRIQVVVLNNEGYIDLVNNCPEDSDVFTIIQSRFDLEAIAKERPGRSIGVLANELTDILSLSDQMKGLPSTLCVEDQFLDGELVAKLVLAHFFPSKNK